MFTVHFFHTSLNRVILQENSPGRTHWNTNSSVASMVWVEIALHPQLRVPSCSGVADILPGGPRHTALCSLTASSCKHGCQPEQEEQRGYFTKEKSKDVSQANTRWKFLKLNPICVTAGRTWRKAAGACESGTSVCVTRQPPALLLVHFTVCKQEAGRLFSAGIFSFACPLVTSLPLPPSLLYITKLTPPPKDGAMWVFPSRLTWTWGWGGIQGTWTHRDHTYFFLTLFL